MVEVNTTINEFIHTIVFDLVDANFIDYDRSSEDVDRACEVLSETFKDVEYIKINKPMILK